MSILNRKRLDENPAHEDGRGRKVDSSAWIVSLLVHLSFLVLISLISTQAARHLPELVLTAPPASDPQIEELSQQEFHFDPEPRDLIGGSAIGGPVEDLPSQLETPDIPLIAGLDMEQQDVGTVELRQVIHAATGAEFNLNHAIKGSAGVGVTGADGAIDRITHEILMSLEELARHSSFGSLISPVAFRVNAKRCIDALIVSTKSSGQSRPAAMMPLPVMTPSRC